MRGSLADVRFQGPTPTVVVPSVARSGTRQSLHFRRWLLACLLEDNHGMDIEPWKRDFHASLGPFQGQLPVPRLLECGREISSQDGDDNVEDR